MKRIETNREQIIKAWDEMNAIEGKYHCSAGYYDRSHSDNIKLGLRNAKIAKLIEAEGLDMARTFSELSLGKFQA